MSGLTEVRLIERLVASDQWAALRRLRPPFDLFEALGTVLMENASSRALAWLLDSDKPHGVGTLLLSEWLTAIHRHGWATGRDGVGLTDLLGLTGDRTVVTTEWSTPAGRRLDLLVRVYRRGELFAVVGVENKHWAGEQEEQVAHYQQALRTAFPDAKRLLIFLTPFGASPTTGDDDDRQCPWVASSYQAVLDALRAMSEELAGEARMFSESLHSHLNAELLGGSAMSNEAKELVRALYRDPDHRQAIRLINDNLPTFGALADRIVNRMRELLAETGPDTQGWRISHYPQRSPDRLQEIKLWPSPMEDAAERLGWALCFMLRCPEGVADLGSQIEARVMVWAGDKDVSKSVPAEPIRKALAAAGASEKRDGSSWYWAWTHIWAGDAHRLEDLADKDVEACAKLLADMLRTTYGPLNEGLAAFP